MTETQKGEADEGRPSGLLYPYWLTYKTVVGSKEPYKTTSHHLEPTPSSPHHTLSQWTATSPAPRTTIAQHELRTCSSLSERLHLYITSQTTRASCITTMTGQLCQRTMRRKRRKMEERLVPTVGPALETQGWWLAGIPLASYLSG